MTRLNTQPTADDDFDNSAQPEGAPWPSYDAPDPAEYPATPASEVMGAHTLLASATTPWDDDSEVDPESGLSFSVPVKTTGEVTIPSNRLLAWPLHPAGSSRVSAANMPALINSAADPSNVPPLTVLQTKDGYMVLDGRLRWHAIKEVHGEDSDVAVRCVLFEGNEAEALQSVADSALGGTPRSAIEMARAVYNLQRYAQISQKAIAERYPVLKKDQVSRMTIAARTVERFPTVFDLLAEPDRVPIDTCVKLAQWLKTAGEQEQSELLEAAEVLLSQGAALKPSKLFDALGLEIENSGSKGKPQGRPEVSDVLESIDVLGFDDQPVGVIEKLDERVMRFQLPDPASMTVHEREAAATGFIRQILDYFGLEVTE